MAAVMSPGRMDAVLPLRRSDVERSAVLFRSLERFFRDLGEVFVVVPDDQRIEIKAELTSISPSVAKRIVPETEVVPELGPYRHVGGWYKQQIIKLAIAEHISSDFYLTLDADVVATRSVSPDDLVQGGRAPVYIIREDLHPRWYARTARLLERPLRQTGIVHNVTPAVLSRNAVREMAAHFDERWQEHRYARGLRQVRQRWAKLRHGRSDRFAPWRLFITSALPWTEYSLYYGFLEAYDRFSAYHFEHPVCVYDIERSVWRAAHVAFDAWSPEPLFTGHGPPFFVVVQSNTGIAVTEVQKKLRPYLETSVHPA